MKLVDSVEIVESLPLIYLRNVKALMISDLHSGFEKKAMNQEMFILRIQFREGLGFCGKGLKTTDSG